MKTFIRQKGQSLVEMVVVIGVVMLLTTGIVSGVTTSLSRSKNIELRSLAVKHAQQGIEISRAARDRGWAAFAQLGATQTTYCVGSDGVFQVSGGTCSSANIDEVYVRSITLYLVPGGTKVSVKASVSWGDITKPENTVAFDTYLTKWQ